MSHNFYIGGCHVILQEGFRFLKRKKRNVIVTEKKRDYRSDKRQAKRTYVQVSSDYGAFELLEKISFPQETEIKRTFLTKKANPNAFWLWDFPIRIVKYLDSDKGFVYDERGNYSGTFQNADLKQLYSRIGEYFRLKKRSKL